MKPLQKYNIIGLLSILVMGEALFQPAGSSAQALKPSYAISYQGSLMSQNSLAEGVFDIRASLYGDPDGLEQIWSGLYRVDVNQGIYHLELGSGQYPLPAPSNLDRPLWLGVSVSGQPELRPLVPLVSVPYALNVADNSITRNKLDVDYVGSLLVNGQKITGEGTAINILGSGGIDVSYDPGSKSILLSGNAASQGGKADRTLSDPLLELGDMIYGDANGHKQRLAGNSSTTKKFLTETGTGSTGAVPVWSTIAASDLPSLPNLTGTLDVSHGGTGATSLTNNGILIGNGNQPISGVTLADGQVLIGSTGAAPIAATLSGTPNRISVTAGAGSITLSTPQDIASTSSPTFSALILSGKATSAATSTSDSSNTLTTKGYVDAKLVGSSGWALTGNSGTTAGTHYLGTTDLQAVDIRTNDIIRLRVNTNGSIQRSGSGDARGLHAVDLQVRRDYDHQVSSGEASVIDGGQFNTSSAAYSAVGGGLGNTVTAPAATIAGGYQNAVKQQFSTVGGGFRNLIHAEHSVIAGGSGNSIGIEGSTWWGSYSTISGGTGNVITGPNSTIGGGLSNVVSAQGSAIFAGQNNRIISGSHSAIVGGQNNVIEAFHGFIGGGLGNGAWSSSVVGGGRGNFAQGFRSFIGAGDSNITAGNHGNYSFIGAGRSNANWGVSAFIGAGEKNTVFNYGVIGGGTNNTVGEYSAIPGGRDLQIHERAFGFNADASGLKTNLGSNTNLAYFGNADLWVGNVDNTARQLRFYEPNASYTYSGTNYTAFKAQAQSANITYTLPAAQGTAGSLLSNDGSGNLAWSTTLKPESIEMGSGKLLLSYSTVNNNGTCGNTTLVLINSTGADAVKSKAALPASGANGQLLIVTTDDPDGAEVDDGATVTAFTTSGSVQFVYAGGAWKRL